MSKMGEFILDVRWVVSSFRTVRAIWTSYDSLCRHFVKAAGDSSMDSKTGLSSRIWHPKLRDLRSIWTWGWCLMLWKSSVNFQRLYRLSPLTRIKLPGLVSGKLWSLFHVNQREVSAIRRRVKQLSDGLFCGVTIVQKTAQIEKLINNEVIFSRRWLILFLLGLSQRFVFISV